MRRSLKFFCLFSLLLLVATPVWAETLKAAPLNPAFLEYQQQVSEAKASGQSVQPTGRIPSPVDLSHLAGQSIVPDTGLKAATTYPSSYDLRTEGFVSPVRNQDPYGDCWTFAAMASMESTAMKLLGAESADLSEWQLTYYAYIDETPELVGFCNYGPDSFPGTADCGGDDFRAAAILSRWTGVALESDVPFGIGNPDGTEPSEYHLSDVMFLYYDATTRYAPASIANVKYALTHYGVVSVGVYAENGWSSAQYATPYFNLATSAAYIPEDNSDGLEVGWANHAVAIVGWDDNFPASNFAQMPPGDGAWIVRNSWGSTWGDEGYFYLSYYDAVLDTGAAYVSAPADNYDNIYQHDPLGLCEMEGIPGDLSPSSAWMANVFTATGTEALTAVSFYAPTVDTTYEISVFTDVTAGPLGGDPTDGSLALTAQSGTLHVPGYRTVVLEDPVLLSAGQTFSVVINIHTPGYNYPLAAEGKLEDYSDKATALPGESFFSSDGVSWFDTTDVDETANLCIKAFTYDTGAATTLNVTDTPSSADINLFQQSETDLLAALEGLGLDASMESVQFLEPGNASGGSWFAFAYPYSSDLQGGTFSHTLCLARNHSTDLYEIPSGAYGARTSAQTDEHVVLIQDGGVFDGDRTCNNVVSSVDLVTIMVSSTVAGGSGGGCSVGFLAPAALLLLAPLALLRKH